MSEYAFAWELWLYQLDEIVSDELLAAISVILLSVVVLSKICLLFSPRFRPSVALATADASLLAWACSRLSHKMVVFKTTPEHVFLHFALAIYAVYNLGLLWNLWKRPNGFPGSQG